MGYEGQVFLPEAFSERLVSFPPCCFSTSNLLACGNASLGPRGKREGRKMSSKQSTQTKSEFKFYIRHWVGL